MQPLLTVCVCFLLITLCANGEQRYAKNFEIEDKGDYQLVTVHNTRIQPNRSYQYALAPKDSPKPQLSDNIKIIRTPIERLVILETVQIGYLEALNQLDSIVGAGSIQYINNKYTLGRVDQGLIKSVQTGQSINAEELLLLQPDLILTSVTGNPAFDLPEKLTRTGLPFVFTTSFMEEHPLGRAEWMCFLAAFFQADDEAQQHYNHIADRYETLSASISDIDKRPTVFASAPYSGIWHMPSGDSYTAQLIHDAGGDYLWKERKTGGNIPLDTETVFLRAANADFWINPSHYRTLDALYAADKRFNLFKAAKLGKVYNNSKQTTERGGNPIWEKGIVQPHNILADLITILHPQQLPKHEFVFYEQLK
ncbi:ABC transporter substrate-binding protein [Coraliomargarita akajimensis]|uniref:Periplasmic binding protein n=1 Tax=Coraliomargarita akajimensis (strain DSM 45221 / IAM 15411 / JCM 23193 / KCTC 12865 / 04OKA010-24) TaxID=583355 RepID=D5EK45_CORAD|nr:ABC transporter substrate-binding protein [Coraliomargarita akajimensis]ADE54794.1 periplasmic binding protein [Coraliomargarita akajimensis DSM 45221]